MKATIYHNPSCSKSRKALELLEAHHGIELEVILYLRHPPDAKTLSKLIKLLNLKAINLLRQAEQHPQLTDEQEIIKALISNPSLMQRPIIVIGQQACIGRPPETVLDLLPDILPK